MRKPLIAGNWKMHKNNDEAIALVKELAPMIEGVQEVEVAVCPPFTALADISRVISELGADIRLGAQDVYPEEEGAFTGEIAPPMLKALALDYVIVGHSERREIIGEKDEFIASKLRAVFDNDMIPILCVGETLEEREAGRAQEKVAGQLAADLENLEESEIPALIIAYEPIWAIGTGETATPQDAQAMTSFIRGRIEEGYGEESASSVRVLYGGSVKPGNVKELMAMADIDGALVGGASLKAADFAAIANYRT